ncbi:GDSL-type esterase/lipase family protein [Vibrio sp. 10N.261.55.A7]|uniref:SGNH/GDSL hydrolase family protein n=1 Tax=Vibrio sp. 10N.261.55.A7 TaxID=1880851 RepID=UPI000C83C4FC|nr:GDSL-type esterase/lipase family protein [Vibrio sp. 10N.261.55.A7]PMK00012.1 hypothetical protein BCU12_20455 [Vibrio sp. 10N.261.55.A7]
MNTNWFFYLILPLILLSTYIKFSGGSQQHYIVLIGDSIAEGHPALHGRLHPAPLNFDADQDSQALSSAFHPGLMIFDADYKSQPGQMSYELSSHFGLPILNHGIGGQTTTDIRNRWPRDVLHKVFDPGDGRGNMTMNFDGVLPYAVYLHAGINDIAEGAKLNTIKENMLFFAASTETNDIKLIINNIGAYSDYSIDMIEVAEKVNDWLISDLSSSYSHITIVDYLDWSSDGTGNYRHLKKNMFADVIHPNKEGYKHFSVYAAQSLSWLNPKAKQ